MIDWRSKILFLFSFDKTLKAAMTLLFAMMVFSSALALIFLVGTQVPLAQFGSPVSASQNPTPLDIPFHLQTALIPLPLPRIEESLVFSYQRERPDLNEDCRNFSVRLKKTNQIRRVTLPARIDFKFEKELQFSNKESAFWAEVQKDGQGIIARFLIDRGENQEEIGSFRFIPEEASFRASSEFSEGSPLKVLADGKILGKDLFLKTYKEGGTFQRLEINNQVIPIKEGDLLVWKEEKWLAVPTMQEAQNFPLARASHVDDKNIIFDAWGLEGYSRISVSSFQQIPFKTKSDEFLSSVRIRSEKQISCMLEKQCFVLRVGDWVLKEENRWKILRKAEEKEGYLQGKVEGELFVFDRIDLKSGQKNVQGNLVNLARSQMIPVNVVAQCQKKALPAREKGKGK